MLETFRKGVAVEVYFKKFAKFKNGMFVLDKSDFGQAIVSLQFKWADQLKVSEMFDAIDLVSNHAYQRQIRMEDIGEVVLQNALYSIDDYQAKAIEEIYQGLKQRQMLAKLRDLFNFYNTRRDNTCQAREFRSIILDKLNLSTQVSEQQVELLLLRYKTMMDASRIEFMKFIQDMEYCDSGI